MQENVYDFEIGLALRGKKKERERKRQVNDDEVNSLKMHNKICIVN
jgi:hypothetical protein